MAKSQAPRVNEVLEDNVMQSEKRRLIEEFGYFNRTHWERASIIDVLEDNDKYLDYVAKDKLYVDSRSGTSKFNHDIQTSLYTDSLNNNLVFSVVSYRKNMTSPSANQQYIDGPNENFVFSSVFPNANESVETVKGGTQNRMLESIHLFRYDPTGDMDHENSEKVYEEYENLYGEEIAKLYKYFFTEKVEHPHFHFSNRTMALAYERTAKANAISLDKLIEYIVHLMDAKKDKSNILNSLDFGMPFLKLIEHPETYKTTIDYRTLQKALKNNSANKQIDKIFKNVERIGDGDVVLIGLEAIFSDLVLLKILRGGDTSLGKSIIPVGPRNDDGFNGVGGVRNLSFISSKKYLAGGSNSRNSEIRNERFDGEPVYEVTMAEIQLATKLASLGKLTSKSVKHTNKMHFEEAKFWLNEETEYLLHEVLRLCENKTSAMKGEGNGPALQ